jgi:hypothetical protein
LIEASRSVNALVTEEEGRGIILERLHKCLLLLRRREGAAEIHVGAKIETCAVRIHYDLTSPDGAKGRSRDGVLVVVDHD